MYLSVFFGYLQHLFIDMISEELEIHVKSFYVTVQVVTAVIAACNLAQL